jgi:hypothetical protein
VRLAAVNVTTPLGLAYCCIGSRAFWFVSLSVLGHRRASAITVSAEPDSVQVKGRQYDKREGAAC